MGGGSSAFKHSLGGRGRDNGFATPSQHHTLCVGASCVCRVKDTLQLGLYEEENNNYNNNIMIIII